MQTYDTIDQFWQEYFSERLPATGFDTWTIAKITHTTDQQYEQLLPPNAGSFGDQAALITLADPLNQQSVRVIIKNASVEACESLRQQYRSRFIEQLMGRFGLFDPAGKLVDAVFDNWEAFAKVWFTQDSDNTLAYNLPLVFDHVSDAEFKIWQDKQFDPCGSQRLIITMFQYRTGDFAKLFVKNVTDAEMARIRVLTMATLNLQIEKLF